MDKANIGEYLSLIYGDNVENIFDKYVFVWDEDNDTVLKFKEYLNLKSIPMNLSKSIPSTSGEIYGLDGRNIFNVSVSLVIGIINNDSLVAKAIISTEQLYRLYSTCLSVMTRDYKNAQITVTNSSIKYSVTVRTYMITNKGEIEACKIQATWYTIEHPELVLITSGNRYLGRFENNKLISFTKG